MGWREVRGTEWGEMRGVGRINEVYVHDVMSMHIGILIYLGPSWMSSIIFRCFNGFKFYDQSSMNFLVALHQFNFC